MINCFKAAVCNFYLSITISVTRRLSDRLAYMGCATALLCGWICDGDIRSLGSWIPIWIKQTSALMIVSYLLSNWNVLPVQQKKKKKVSLRQSFNPSDFASCQNFSKAMPIFTLVLAETSVAVFCRLSAVWGDSAFVNDDCSLELYRFKASGRQV